MSDHHVDVPFTCPACGVEQDGLMSRDTPFLPDDGDAIVCLYCEIVNVWQGRGLRLATADEQLEYAADERIQKILWAIRRVKLIHGPPRGGRL